MRTRLVLVSALFAAMVAIAAAPQAPAGPGLMSPWVGSNPLVSLAYAQGGQQPVTPEPEAVEEPVQGPPEPEAVEEPVQGPPEPDVVEEPVQGPPEPDVVEEPVQGLPEPDVVEEPEPEPAPEPTLGDFWGALQSAITAGAANAVTVGASFDALDSALQALLDAEQAHTAAMEGQGEHDADIRTAAQALVDFVTASYLE